MSSSPEPSASRLCQTCSQFIDTAFDSSQFDSLPPLNSPDALDWTKYVRKLRTFTLQSISEDSGEACNLCSHLRRMVSVGSYNKMPPVMRTAYSASYKESEPGDGYTLAATSTRFLYQLPDESVAVSAGNPKTKASLDAVGPLDIAQSPVAPVVLFVLESSNTLERAVYRMSYLRGGMKKRIHPISYELLQYVARAVHDGSGFIYEVTEQSFTQQPFNPGALFLGFLVVPERIDFCRLQSWISYCEECHSLSCNSHAPGVSPLAPHMKLIDCSTRTMVSAELGMRYAALSYVRGGLPVEKFNYPLLPADLPLTIVDAMEVTVKLGLNYLLGDHYCIWQEDEIHKMGQVRCMDRIYRDAEFTIVAAAGGDPSYGLPGVSSRERKSGSQLFSGVGGKWLMSIMFDKQHKWVMQTLKSVFHVEKKSI